MAEKRLTLLIYGADRELWRGGRATLSITRVQPGNARELKRLVLPAKTSTVNITMDPRFDQQQAYLVVLTVAKHRDAWCAITHGTFVRTEDGGPVERDEAIVRLLLVPNKTSIADPGAGYDQMLEAASPFVTKPGFSRATYDTLSHPATMAVLNIEAKLRGTRLGNLPLLSFVQGLRSAEVDRVFLYMDAEAKRRVKDSADFLSAGGHPGHPDSWKHKKFPTGNIQLSFAREPETINGGLAYSVDVDIDLERGVAHVVEWLDNNVFKVNKTDQTRIYALLYGQGITPYYKLAQV